MIRSLKTRFVVYGVVLTWLVGGAVATVAWLRLRAGLDGGPLVDDGRRAVLAFVLTILALTVVASALAGLVAARIARPLARLTALAAGEPERIERDDAAPDEITVLTDSLNRLIDRVRARTRELGESRAEARQTLSDYLEVLAFVAHEIRHPVAGAQSKLSLIRKGYLGEVPEKLDPALAKIDRYLEDGLALSDQFNQLSQAETKGFTAHGRRVEDVRKDLVEPVLSTWEDTAAERRMEVRVAGEGAPFVLDPDLARTAFGNLLGNAFKYGEVGSAVDVEIEEVEGALHLSVTNRGVGIPEERYGELFGKFSRLGDPRLEDRRGTGVGLYLVQRMMQAQGGDVLVSGEYGSYVTFRLVFPPGAPEAPREEAS